jgi:hypothetical protein
MKKNLGKSFAVAAQCIILSAALGLTRAQSPAPQITQPSVPPRTPADPYAASFAGLTYTPQQKVAIGKIREDIESRKAVVRKSDQLNDDQKNAMLSGYTRMEYSLIYKELTFAQKKLVSGRLHAQGLAGQAAPNSPAPQR